MIELRPYQLDIIDKTRTALATAQSVVMVLPTGGGKTLTTGFMLARAREKGKRSIFCVHRVELLYQTSAAFTKLGIPHGFIAAGEDYDPAQQVYIASIDTLRRRMDDIAPPDFLVIDEAHRAPCESWKKVINHFPTAKKLLITATPERLDGKGLKHVADSMVSGVTTRWLIDNGFLAPFKIWAAAHKPDLTGVRTTGGDYNVGDLAKAMSKSVLTGNAIEHYQAHAADAQALVFAVTCEHSREIVAQFNAAGIPSAHLDGETPKLQREDMVERFRYGEIRVLSNVNLFTEGFDVPAAGCCIMLRPTKSLSLYLQMVGRVLRPQEGKTAIILDHAGNIHTHGAPDIDRDWSLDGKKGRKITKPPPMTTCENCYHMWQRKPREPKICPSCGHVHEVEKREIETETGNLEQITSVNSPWAWAAHRSLRTILPRVKSMGDLNEIAKVRGYKPGWAYFRGKDMGLV